LGGVPEFKLGLGGEGPNLKKTKKKNGNLTSHTRVGQFYQLAFFFFLFEKNKTKPELLHISLLGLASWVTYTARRHSH
jgi:hypothetical protein